MSNKRPLSKEEEALCLARIPKLEEKKRRLEVKLREIDHMIAEGLYINYLEKLDELRMKKREICESIQEIDVGLVTIKSQIKQGVEIKTNSGGN